MPQNLGVVVVLLNSNNEVLLGKRKGGYKAGVYGLPGGRIDVGEKLEVAAQRELKEETGVQASDLNFVGFVKDFQKENDFDFIHFVFICRKWQGEIVNIEPEKCEGWEFHTPSDLPKKMLLAHRKAIALLTNEKQFVEI